MSDGSYRDPERPDVFVVPLDPKLDPRANIDPYPWFMRGNAHAPLRIEISDIGLVLRAPNGDVLGDRNAGTLLFTPISVRSPLQQVLSKCPGWYMQHRAGTDLIATYLPELLFPGVPDANPGHIVGYWLGSGSFRAIRGALYPLPPQA